MKCERVCVPHYSGCVHLCNWVNFRAFAGATVHDCFNWLSVLVLLPLEAVSGLLRHLSQATVDTLQLSTGDEAPELLKVLTEPLTGLIIQVNLHVLVAEAGEIFCQCSRRR